MQGRLSVYSGVQGFDSSNTGNSLVLRNSDGSINVGAVNASSINNSGGTSNGVANFTGAGTLGNATLITVDGTSAAYNVTLPVASASAGVIYFITIKNATHTVTIISNGSDNIVSSGTPTATSYALSTIGQQIIIWSDGTQWYVK